MAVIDRERRPLVIGEQLRSAREALAFSIEDVAEQLGIPPDELILWEEGKAQPSIERLWALADLYQRAVDYFLTHTEPMPRDFSFRVTKRQSFSEMPSAARKVLATFDELCRAALELSKLSGEPRKVLMTRYAQTIQPDALAEVERKRLDLDGRPVKDIKQVLEKQGVWVFELPVPEAEFSGFSWWHKAYGPCVLVNASDIPGRRTFTLAHEWAHLIRPEYPSLCDIDLNSNAPEERYANRFAACFLMPEKDLRLEFQLRSISRVYPDSGKVRNLSGRYGVSFEALVWRLMELDLISRDAAQGLLTGGEPKPFPRRPRVPMWRRKLGESYVSAAFRAHHEGKISLGKLAQYLQISPYAVQKALEKEKGASQAGNHQTDPK